MTETCDRARGRHQQSQQHRDGGGLAGAIAAQQPERRPRRHIEADRIDRQHFAVPLRQVPYPDRIHDRVHAGGLGSRDRFAKGEAKDRLDDDADVLTLRPHDRTSPPPLRPLPPGQRVYAVGDVHGCLDRLVALHEQIAEDLAARPVDTRCWCIWATMSIAARRPRSDRVAGRRSARSGHEVVNLMGNHELMMLTALASIRRGRSNPLADEWRGRLTDELGRASCAPPQNWAGRIPLQHLIFLRDLRITHRIGPYLFVHAGIRPGVALEQQIRQDLLWIREPFLSSKIDHGSVVVHGHTPKHEPDGAAESHWHRYRRGPRRRANLCRSGRGQPGVSARIASGVPSLQGRTINRRLPHEHCLQLYQAHFTADGMNQITPEPGPDQPQPDLAAAVRRLGHTSVLVIGDVMLDRYSYGDVTRISVEAPVPILAIEREVALPGGAGNVVRNLTALGAAGLHLRGG